MQASQIMPGTTYAVEFLFPGKEQKTLARFMVRSVTTTVKRTDPHQKRPSPHDYVTTVEGVLDARDLPPEVLDGKSQEEKDKILVRKFRPDSVLGVYSEYKALADRRAAEIEARRLKLQHENAVCLELRRVFYQLIGQETSQDATDYGQAFQVSRYNENQLSVHPEGSKKLLEALQNLMMTRDAAMPQRELLKQAS